MSRLLATLEVLWGRLRGDLRSPVQRRADRQLEDFMHRNRNWLANGERHAHRT